MPLLSIHRGSCGERAPVAPKREPNGLSVHQSCALDREARSENRTGRIFGINVEGFALTLTLMLIRPGVLVKATHRLFQAAVPVRRVRCRPFGARRPQRLFVEGWKVPPAVGEAQGSAAEYQFLSFTGYHGFVEDNFRDVIHSEGE